MSKMTRDEQEMLDHLLAKRLASVEQAGVEEAKMEHEMEEEIAKTQAKLYFLKMGPYGDVSNPEVLKKLRSLFEAQGKIEKILDGKKRDIEGRWSAPSKADYLLFLKQLEERMLEIAITSHDLLSLLPLGEADETFFKAEFVRSTDESNKRHRAFTSADLGGCECRTTSACDSSKNRCPCSNARKSCGSACRCCNSTSCHNIHKSSSRASSVVGPH